MRIITPLLSFAAASLAGAAQAQPYTVVPPPERLTLAGVLVHAAPVVQIALALLFAGAIAAVASWGVSLGKVGRADAKGLARALSRLKLVRSGAAPLGAMAASYGLLNSFIGLANVRPAPDVHVLAHAWAEAATAVMLGFFVMTLAVLCERHLEGRIRSAAA